MIHISETLLIHSVEGFLTTSEINQLRGGIDTLIDRNGPRRYDADRETTMHAIPGYTPAQAMAIYEPLGRLEITDLPDDVAVVLGNATERAMPIIRTAMPAITSCRPWTYVEYRYGQHITPHIDGIAPDHRAWPRQIAGISVVIDAAVDGGDFYVETTGSPALWSRRDVNAHGYAAPMSLSHDDADDSAEWFRAIPRTRWTVNPGQGTALLYGSQLTHGTEPVRQGRARKFISWLIAQPVD
ncbi:MAG: hypothetical protein H7Y15_04455 [Pseudonocardia sp.]|nr:hypothetical protein [Pseudonocardia sp.]